MYLNTKRVPKRREKGKAQATRQTNHQNIRNRRLQAQCPCWPYTSQGVKILTVLGQALLEKKLPVTVLKMEKISSKCR
jgi:hypothetical protein